MCREEKNRKKKIVPLKQMIVVEEINTFCWIDFFLAHVPLIISHVGDIRVLSLSFDVSSIISSEWLCTSRMDRESIIYVWTMNQICSAYCTLRDKINIIMRTVVSPVSLSSSYPVWSSQWRSDDCPWLPVVITFFLSWSTCAALSLAATLCVVTMNWILTTVVSRSFVLRDIHSFFFFLLIAFNEIARFIFRRLVLVRQFIFVYRDCHFSAFFWFERIFTLQCFNDHSIILSIPWGITVICDHTNCHQLSSCPLVKTALVSWSSFKNVSKFYWLFRNIPTSHWSLLARPLWLSKWCLSFTDVMYSMSSRSFLQRLLLQILCTRNVITLNCLMSDLSSTEHSVIITM